MSETAVPNQQPSVDPGAVRLAVVGECPGIEEQHWVICLQGHGFSTRHWQNRQLVERSRCPLCGSQSFTPKPRPFSGESGRLLDDLLREASLPRERCFIGNCCRVPLRDDEKRLNTPEVRSGLERLAVDLEEFEPHCVLVLGNLALIAFHTQPEPKITNWRGSLFEGWLGNKPYKVCAAVHPASILREPSQLVLLRKDVARAVAEAALPTLALPTRTFDAPRDVAEVCFRLSQIQYAGLPIGHDIEGGCDTGVTVCSFATSPTFALSIPFKRLDWSDVWSADDAAQILAAIRALLEDSAVPKVMHNGGYEMFVWAWRHGITIRNAEDTMILWNVMFPELLKDLSVVSSLLTKQPFWGTPDDWGVPAGQEPTDEDRNIYNVIDSSVTLECWQAMQPSITADQRRFYEHQRALLEPVLDMELRGLRYDSAARDAMVVQVNREVFAMTGELDSLAGIAPPTFGDVAETVCFKRSQEKIKTWQDVLVHAKPSFREPL